MPQNKKTKSALIAEDSRDIKIDWHGTMANILEEQLFLLRDRSHFSIDMFPIDIGSAVTVQEFHSENHGFFQDSTDYKKLIVDGKVHYVEYSSYSSDGLNNFYWVEMYMPKHESKSVRVIKGSAMPGASSDTLMPFKKIERDEVKRLLEDKDISTDKTVWEYSVRHDDVPKIKFWEKRGSYRAVIDDFNDIIVEELGNGINKYVAKLAKKPGYEVSHSTAGDIAKLANKLKDNAFITKVCKTLEKYSNASVENQILCKMNNINPDEKEMIERADTIFSLKEVVDNLNKRVNDGAAYSIVNVLHEASRYAKDIDQILGINKMMSKESDESMKELAEYLDYGITKFKNDTKILRYSGLIKKIGYNTMNSVEKEELCEIVDKDLDSLFVKNTRNSDAILAYLRSGCKLPKPDENNINDYRKMASDYVKGTFGLTREISLDQITTLFSMDKDDNILHDGLNQFEFSSDTEVDEHIAKTVKLFNRSEDKDAKFYSFDKSNVKDLAFSRNELVRYSIISILGSKEKDVARDAFEAVSSIVGEKTVYKARNEFNSRYKHLTKDIVDAFRKSDYEKAYEILKTAKDESILDVLNAANFRNVSLGNAAFVKAVESKNPLDYDSGIQIACAYLPRGDDILDYNDDKKIILVRYDIGNKTLGSAICYLEGNKLLVDSVEGHRVFRDDKIFEIVYKDLTSRAAKKGVDTVIFNKTTYNDTPNAFLEYLKREKLPKNDVIRKKIKMTLNTECYLEADKTVDAYVWKNQGI